MTKLESPSSPAEEQYSISRGRHQRSLKQTEADKDQVTDELEEGRITRAGIDTRNRLSEQAKTLESLIGHLAAEIEAEQDS